MKLLVCVDGSEYSRSCCSYAAWMAGKLGAEIEVVYVSDLRQFEAPFIADLGGSLGLQPSQTVLPKLQELEKQKAALVLKGAEKLTREAGFSGELALTHKTGFLVDSLAELEASASLTVIGKRGENANFATEHLGSTMERVARAARIPCLVASRSFRPVKKLMIAYQNASSCEAAVDYFCSTKAFCDLEFHLVSVARNDCEGTVLSDLKKAEQRLVDAGLDAVCQMLHGAVAPTLSEYAHEGAIDILAMGAYGHSKIRHLIIGSATTEILRDCRLPTLLFR